jgi:hypothetical protein
MPPSGSRIAILTGARGPVALPGGAIEAVGGWVGPMAVEQAASSAASTPSAIARHACALLKAGFKRVRIR